MEKQIVDVEFEDGMMCIAKIIKDLGTEYEVSLLDYIGDGILDFDNELEIIPKDSISGFYDTTCLEDTGLYEKLLTGGYEQVDESDTEYVLPSDEDDDSGSDVSLDEEI